MYCRMLNSFTNIHCHVSIKNVINFKESELLKSLLHAEYYVVYYLLYTRVTLDAPYTKNVSSTAIFTYMKRKFQVYVCSTC